jgi:2-haloacid dehalogenase
MWVLFDLNGTLVDPAVLTEPGALAEAALDEANMMAMVSSLAGQDAAFRPLFGAALERGFARAGHGGDDARERASQALAGMPGMPAFAEAPAALARLRAGGFSLAVLSQSTVEASETVLERSGLREAFAAVLSAPELGAFKPEGLAYTAALERVGAAEDAWFVAGHWWDVAGAAFAGLRTAWVSRTDLAYPVAMPEPDVRAADLGAVADALLG